MAVLDTGAQDIYVPRPIAEHLGYDIRQISKGTKFYGVKGGKTSYPIMIEKIIMRDSSKCAVGPVMARTSETDPVGGYLLLGRPFIRAVGMKIAFEKFKDDYRIQCTKTGRDASLPKETADPNSMFHKFSLTYGGKTLAGPCYVDTGATITLLPMWLAQDLGMNPQPMMGRAQGAGGSFTIFLGSLDKISMDGTRCAVDRPFRVIVTPYSRFPIVGVDFFKHTGMTIDFSKGTPKYLCGR